jgi:hypothetical protein
MRSRNALRRVLTTNQIDVAIDACVRGAGCAAHPDGLSARTAAVTQCACICRLRRAAAAEMTSMVKNRETQLLLMPKREVSPFEARLEWRR